MTFRQTAVDRAIGTHLGQFFWTLLPDIHDGLERDEEDPAFPELWSPPSEEVSRVFDEDPLVEYPVIYLGADRLLGHTDRPFEFPGVDGSPIPLSKYIGCLRRFQILQLTRPPQAARDLLMAAVSYIAHKYSCEAALDFIDKLWRGRWLADHFQIGMLRRSLLAGGTPEGLARLLADRAGAGEAAGDIILRERALKASAESVDEWFFGLYCLMPEAVTWLTTVRDMREEEEDDELSKYDRGLDEFLADAGTTLHIPILGRRRNEGLADEYFMDPIAKSSSAAEALAAIRGLRGRSIFPQIWYRMAEESIKRAEAASEGGTYDDFLRGLRMSDRDRLNRVDLAQAFSYMVTADGKKEHFLFTGELFDYFETEETPPDPLGGMTISFD